ncbi:MAG: 50S ribosomal protein L10 [Euryarchaeota archaeon]
MAVQSKGEPPAGYEPKVAEWKREEVRELKRLMDEYENVGIVNLEGLPAPQLQEIRAKLRENDTIIRMSRNTLMRIAIEEKLDERPELEPLLDYIEGPVAFIFTNQDPFRLYRILEESKASAPAKPGDIAPKDIVVPEGPTPFEPGPIVSELQEVGLPAQIQDGKVVITEETVIVEEGEEIDEKTAEILKKLEIEPMEVGVDLVAIVAEGTLFEKDDLAIDIEECEERIREAARHAFNLSINAAIPTTETADLLVTKAHTEALNLAVNAGVPVPDETVMGAILARAHGEMLALAGAIAEVDEEALSDELLERLEAAPAAEEAEEEAEEEEEGEEEEEEEEEETEEEEAAAGLGALFG